MSYRFHLTDVFTNTRYRGNQLATVILEEDIPTETMLQITREFNFSETSFVLQPQYGNTTFQTRIFTPSGEVPFAGHPTLGTAWLMSRYYNRNTKQILLDLPVGVIPVEICADTLWMTQQKAEFTEILPREEMSQLLNIPLAGIRDDLPVETVSTGLPSILIPLKDLATMRQAYPAIDKYRDFFSKREPATLYLFTEETYLPENSINARSFFDMQRIAEDPATGSAAGCLGAYLQKHLSTGIEASIEQGFEIGRNSLIKLKVTEDTLKVGGSVALVAQGELD